MLLLNINRKPYKGSLMTLSYLTLGDLKRSKSRSLRFQSLIHLAKEAELGHVLLLNMYRNIWESIDVITFDFNDLERSMSRSLIFGRLISRKGADSGHMLLLNTNKKSHGESLTAPSHLTWGDLERLNSRSFTFLSLICHKGAELGYMLLLNI